jgi:hypothetical protein
MTFFTKLYGDWADLSVRVEAKELDGQIYIAGVFVDGFSSDDIFPLLNGMCVERLKREARKKKLRIGLFTEPDPDDCDPDEHISRTGD